jgi:hypothetical protein
MKENKLIAEFMGVEDHQEMGEYVTPNYNTSWNWLLPVVEKIESLGYEVQIRKFDCIIFQLLDTLEYKPVIGSISSASGKMDSTYIAVVEFIKEYNKK